jgi:glycosyltransferase involved in cell wall biosynthesis
MHLLMKGLNEEHNVKRVVGDFHDLDFVDDIIVIDGGSTDYTVPELLRFKKVKVFVHPWLDWYHDMEVSQSNIALSYIPNGDLLFIMDFDERMNQPLKELLSKINEEDAFEEAGLVARKTRDLVRYPNSPHAIIGDDGWPLTSHDIGQWPDFQCRLIRKTPQLHWINSPHHVLSGHKSEVCLPVDCYIEHFEKDDYRDRTRIEKKWLRAQAVRESLGLTADVFETQVKPELAEFAYMDYWIGSHGTK